MAPRVGIAIIWYDVFAPFYDAAVARIYRPYRSRIADALSLSPGDAVVDLACGTGQNFEELVGRVGPAGLVVGIDASKGMLHRARRRCEKHGWTNVRLVDKDARFALREDLFEGDAERKAQAVVCTLGLSAMPSWQEVLASAISWVEPGGRIVLFDVYADRWVPQQAVVSLVAQADLKRQSWRALEAIADRFQTLITTTHLGTFAQHWLHSCQIFTVKAGRLTLLT